MKDQSVKPFRNLCMYCRQSLQLNNDKICSLCEKILDQYGSLGFYEGLIEPPYFLPLNEALFLNEINLQLNERIMPLDKSSELDLQSINSIFFCWVNEDELPKQIYSLHLNDAEVSELSVKIGDLQHLRLLELKNNNMQYLPASISKLLKLREINASNNLLVSIPSEIGDLSGLEILDVSHNYIKELPLSFGNLQKLKIFRITNNHLTNLPDRFIALRNLTTLELGMNNLSSLPKSIGMLPRLRNLSVEKNFLIDIPDCIMDLSSIVNLNLRNNQISSLSSRFTSFLDKKLKLKYILLSNNKIRIIPEELSFNGTLALDNNQITSVPVTILEQLTGELDLSRNPLDNKTLNWIIAKSSHIDTTGFQVIENLRILI